MPDWRLIDTNEITGLKTYSWMDEATGECFYRYEQDIEGALEANKAAQNEGFDKRADMWHAAHVPDVVQLEWKAKYGVELWNPDHKEAVKRLLNSNEYRYLRVKNFII